MVCKTKYSSSILLGTSQETDCEVGLFLLWLLDGLVVCGVLLPPVVV